MRDTRKSRSTLVRRAPRRAASLERLEDRRLLAATTPIISEFLAINDSSIQDEDGNRSDWIELYNPTASDVNLDGYFLTDDALDLDKWRLPAATIPSNGYLIVWASSKDRAVVGAPLHTNFNLDGPLGEYLALVAPDRVTPVSEFNPFPPQGSDVSYGITATQTTTPIIGPRATARTRIPTSTDNLGLTWTQPTFNDAGWIAGVTGIGYETDSPPQPAPGFRVRMVDVNGGTDGTIDHMGDAIALLDNTAPAGSFTIASDTVATRTTVNFGGGGFFGSDQTFPNGSLPSLSQGDPIRTDYALRANASVYIPAGQWTIGVDSDDGFRLRVPGVTFLSRTNENYDGYSGSGEDTLVYSAPRGAGTVTFATFTVPAGGLETTLQLDFYERQGGDSVELSIASGHRASFSTGTFQLLGNNVLGWTSSAFDPANPPPVNYRRLISTDIQAQMFNVNPSAFIRVPFSVANANDYDTLRLQMKYDDGFVAYLNGVEVARRNAPAALPYNAQAPTARNPESLAVTYESISIPATALRTGSNLLAIHALNATRGSSDLLIYPELQGFTSSVGTVNRFFAEPTPGAANSTPDSLGVVADTKFNIDRGFFDAPFELEISTLTEGAEIRYTTDGTPPTANTGTVYTGPITVNRTTTLRAAAYKTGYVSSNVDTQTYIFLDDVIRQAEGVAPAGPDWPAPGRVNSQIIDYGMDQGVVNANLATIKNDLKAIPTFSIVMKTSDLFNASSGIYVNPGGDGLPWERPGSVELIYPDGTKKGFQIDAGIRLRGGYSRSGDNPKHAFRFFFRNEYDGDLKFPMFGPGGSSSFDGFDLRTFQNYSWSFGGDSNGTFMRDQLNRDLQLAMGQDGERGDYYHLYINGQYWGLYNTAERAEANHGADYFGGDADDYDVVKVDPDLGYNIEATDGNMDAWNQLYTLLRGNNLAPVSEAVLQQVQGNNPDGTRNPAYPVLLDVENLIDYMLVIYWGGNLDAPISNFIGNNSPNNFFALRNRTGNEGFRFYVHDAEHTMLPWDSGRNRLGNTPGQGFEAGNQGVGKSNPQWFFQRLWHLPSFRLQVADKVQKHMVNAGGVLTPQKVTEFANRRKLEIDRAVVGESARWGDSKVATSYTRNTWLSAVSNVSGWVNGRTATVLSQLRAWNLFPSLNAPRYSQQGGQVPVDYSLTITTPGAPAGTSIYYTLDGSDPRDRDGTPRGILYTGPITVRDTTQVKTRALNGATWSALNAAIFTIDLAALRITEVMYNPAPAPAGSVLNRDDFEFLELTNTGQTERDLTGVKIAGGIDFTFPDNFKLAAGARIVVAKNVAAFQSRYGNGVTVLGPYASQLSDGGELLRIESATGQVSLSFTYNDAWYPQTDGEGFSLNILNPAGPMSSWNLKQSWVASNRFGGTPGTPDDSPAIGSVIVNEVLASPEPGSPTGDFIEVRNTTDAPFDVSGWYLSDSAANLRKFRIPDGTVLPAGAYAVFHQAQLGFDIAPNAAGEIFVSSGDAAGNILGYRESKRYAVGETGFSFGEHVKTTGGTDFVAMQSPTPGLANGAPRVGPVVINELMYHPPNFAMEYIELRNLTGSDVLLHDPADPTSAWRFVGDFEYAFPVGAYVPAFGFVLLIPGDEATFRSVYNMPPGVPIHGGTPALDNLKENITLYRPTPAGDVLVDRVHYDYNPGAAPWPAGAADTGYSIGRVNSGDYGNDAGNWGLDALAGSPGRTNHDTDGPTVDVVDVSPDPRTTPVDSITIVFNEPVTGFDLTDVRFTRDGGANLLTAAQTLASSDALNWTLSGLSGLTATPGSYTLSVVGGSISGIEDWAGNDLSGTADDTWRVGGAPAGRVVGRHVFYNGSAFDGSNTAPSAQDDAAIAPDKQALLPGQAAAFVNYTSYSRGINGLMVDVSGLLADLTAADFGFKVGNDTDPGAWLDAPAPISISRRNGIGTGGSDRITLIWADGAIKNTWLRVTVLANSRTGLPAADVFYFGNLTGETGDSTTGAVVTAADVLAVRSAIGATAPITHNLDFNRDGRVNTSDLVLARASLANGSLTLITAPAAAPSAAGASAAATQSATSVVSVASAEATTVSAAAPATRAAPVRATARFSATPIAAPTRVRVAPARRGTLLLEAADVLGRQ